MIPYEELVQSLHELNGRVPARQREESKPRVSGSLPKAAAPPAKAPSQPAMPAVDPYDDFGAPLPADEVSPLVTDIPELGDSFEVLTEEPLPPPAEGAMEDAFDILSETELPPPPDELAPAAGDLPAPSAADYEVLGDQAFSGFFEGDAPGGVIEDIADAPTPPPEEEFDFDLPPPPPA